MVAANNALGNGQPKAITAGATANHRVENILLQLRANAGAIVDNVYPAYQAVASRAYGELAQGPGAKSNGGRRV